MHTHVLKQCSSYVQHNDVQSTQHAQLGTMSILYHCTQGTSRQQLCFASHSDVWLHAHVLQLCPYIPLLVSYMMASRCFWLRLSASELPHNLTTPIWQNLCQASGESDGIYQWGFAFERPYMNPSVKVCLSSVSVSLHLRQALPCHLNQVGMFCFLQKESQLPRADFACIGTELHSNCAIITKCSY